MIIMKKNFRGIEALIVTDPKETILSIIRAEDVEYSYGVVVNFIIFDEDDVTPIEVRSYVKRKRKKPYLLLLTKQPLTYDIVVEYPSSSIIYLTTEEKKYLSEYHHEDTIDSLDQFTPLIKGFKVKYENVEGDIFYVPEQPTLFFWSYLGAKDYGRAQREALEIAKSVYVVNASYTMVGEPIKMRGHRL